MRNDNRKNDELRSVTIIPDFVMHPEGSVLIQAGNTKVICNASIENKVPPFMRGQGKGWIAAEYAMLPRATERRNIRESSKGKVSGRTMEIQRLIGRALRSVVQLEKIGERTIWVDCDVIQADGGTRTASITGAFAAMVLALGNLHHKGLIKRIPVTEWLAAVSVGVTPDGTTVLDLNYDEDKAAHVDMNIVMTGKGEYVEIQGTGEEATFTSSQLQKMLALSETGIKQLFTIQADMLGDLSAHIGTSYNHNHSV